MNRAIVLFTALVLTLPGAVIGQEATGRGPVIIDINGPRRDLYKIAVPRLVGDGDVGTTVADIVSGDLGICGWFKVLDPRSFLAKLEQEGTGVVVQDWRNVGAEGVSKGRASVAGSEMILEFKLYELGRGDRAVLSKTYKGTKAQLRAFSHAWSNEVVKYFTGEDGFFSSRIAFSAPSGGGKKDIYTMDYDGANVFRVTGNGSQNILPNWSPNGKQIVFTSFLRGNPDLYIVSASGGRAKRISARPGVNMGGAFSPDGSKVTATLSQDGNSEVYLLGADGAIIKRLTDNPFIDTSATWSPDGGQIAFVSNRHGSPQIWTMGASGSGQSKLTRVGTYNQEPSWCPRCTQPTIAFSARDEKGVFDCFTIQVGSGQIVRLTEGQGTNEHPSWAPNGRALAVASSRGGIWLTTADGKIQKQVYKGSAEAPAWGPAARP